MESRVSHKDNILMSNRVMPGDSHNIWIHLINKYFVEAFSAETIMKVIQGTFDFTKSIL